MWQPGVLWVEVIISYKTGKQKRHARWKVGRLRSSRERPFVTQEVSNRRPLLTTAHRKEASVAWRPPESSSLESFTWANAFRSLKNDLMKLQLCASLGNAYITPVTFIRNDHSAGTISLQEFCPKSQFLQGRLTPSLGLSGRHLKVLWIIPPLIQHSWRPAFQLLAKYISEKV